MPKENDDNEAAEQARIGEPGTLPRTFCKVCEVEVLPEGRGVCPRCETFLKLNFVARRHAVNVLRRQQLLDKLIREYAPETTLHLSTCEVLAGVLEQLEVLKPSSIEHQRLVQQKQTLGAELEEWKRTRKKNEPSPYDGWSAEQVDARYIELLGEAFKRRTGPLSGPCPFCGVCPASVEPVHEEPGAKRKGLTSHDVNEIPEPETPTPSSHIETLDTGPTAPCPYCHQFTLRCAEIKSTNLDTWRALHFNDPDEVQRRAEAATAEMLHQLGKPSPWL